jgi:hypothetical protein
MPLMHIEMQVSTLGTQVVLLFLIAIPVACISWTVRTEVKSAGDWRSESSLCTDG